MGWSSVIWFLTMQKMVYYFLIPLFLDCNWICVLFVGRFITLFQALLSRSVVMIVFLLLVSSGNFILLLGI